MCRGVAGKFRLVGKSTKTIQWWHGIDDLPGFAIRVTRKSKSYVLEKRVDGVNRRITIGKCNGMSLESAKKQACIMLGDIAKGNDAKTGKRINTLHDITLREVLQKFLEVKPIRESTQRNYHFAINRHFNDWLDTLFPGCLAIERGIASILDKALSRTTSLETGTEPSLRFKMEWRAIS